MIRCRVPGVNDDHYSPPGSVLFNTTSGIQEYNVTECTIEINGSTTKCQSLVYDQSLYTATIISKVNILRLIVTAGCMTKVSTQHKHTETNCHSWVYDQSLYTATIVSKVNILRLNVTAGCMTKVSTQPPLYLR